MTVLVIGASGFLGRNLTAQLRESGEDVICTTRSESSEEKNFSVDLGRKNEHQKVLSLVELYGITRIVNMAASQVSPSDRAKSDDKQTNLFFENLNAILTKEKNLKLLQIGTVFNVDKSDSYFASKSLIRNLLQESSVNEQISILDLPKVIGAGEPLGRFTSDVMQTLILGTEQVVLHPCHKRNFVSLCDVLLLMLRILEGLDTSSDEYPMYPTETFSNYDVVQSIMGSSLREHKGISYDHDQIHGKCGICPADEDELIIRPEFFGTRKINYFLMDQVQNVEEALKDQFVAAQLAHRTQVS